MGAQESDQIVRRTQRPKANGSFSKDTSVTGHQVPALRILFLTSRLEVLGGSEKNLRDLVTNLRRDLFEPYVMALRGGTVLEQIANSGIRAEDLRIGSLLTLQSLHRACKIIRFIRKERIAILVCYHEDADIWGGIVGYFSRIPILISSKRDMGYQTSTKHLRAYRYVNPVFHRFIAVSEAVKRQVSRIQGIPAEKITVVYNGVAVNENSSIRRSRVVHELLGVANDRIVVGMVASFREVKGQEYFVLAAVEVLRVRNDVEFVIVGYKDTVYYEKVDGLIRKMGIANRVHCVGHRSDVEALLASFDIFVLSSVQEGFPNAILEAMAAGLAVVAPNSGGIPEAVTSEVGLLYEPGDFKGLARAILLLAGDVKGRSAMGYRGRVAVQRRFSLEMMVRSYEELFLSEIRGASADGRLTDPEHRECDKAATGDRTTS